MHEKEFLLKDLTTEGLLGEDRRLGEICSKRVYRILMAQCGKTKTEDVENGADFFRSQSTRTFANCKWAKVNVDFDLVNSQHHLLFGRLYVSQLQLVLKSFCLQLLLHVKI